LQRLCQLPFNEIKLDADFIRNLAHEPRCRAAISSTLALGEALGMSVVIEGIETAAQRRTAGAGLHARAGLLVRTADGRGRSVELAATAQPRQRNRRMSGFLGKILQSCSGEMRSLGAPPPSFGTSSMINKTLRILIADPQHFHRMKIERLFNHLEYFRVARCRVCWSC
jgi:hypothetical protein